MSGRGGERKAARSRAGELDGARRRKPVDDGVAQGLHGLANLLHGMTLRLTLLRRDPQCVARQATTIDALGAALADATEMVARMHARVAAKESVRADRRRRGTRAAATGADRER